MPSSNQTPLTAPHHRSEHDFSLRAVEWEAAVFDNAEYFAVIEMRSGNLLNGVHRRYAQFTYFPWAVRCAQEKPDACIYAIAKSGRFTMIDREKWDQWLTRWWETYDLHHGTPLPHTTQHHTTQHVRMVRRS